MPRQPKIIELVAIEPRKFVDDPYNEIAVNGEDLGDHFPSFPKQYKIGEPPLYRTTVDALEAAKAGQHFYGSQIEGAELVIFVNGEPLVEIHRAVEATLYKPSKKKGAAPDLYDNLPQEIGRKPSAE